MTETSRKMGRPSSYSTEAAIAICEELPYADGGLEEVCDKPDMPGVRTVYRWLADPANIEFRQMYARAREMTGEVQAQRALRDALVAGDAQLGRLKFDARKWTAAKLAPRKYGDKVALTGADGGAIRTVDETALAKLSDAELEQLTAIRAKLADADPASGGEG